MKNVDEKDLEKVSGGRADGLQIPAPRLQKEQPTLDQGGDGDTTRG
jgi:bacteriocin-like protein